MSDAPPLCRCGCGNQVEWNHKHARWNAYVHGHNLKDPDNIEHRLEHEEEDGDPFEARMEARFRRFDDDS